MIPFIQNQEQMKLFYGDLNHKVVAYDGKIERGKE